MIIVRYGTSIVINIVFQIIFYPFLGCIHNDIRRAYIFAQ